MPLLQIEFMDYLLLKRNVPFVLTGLQRSFACDASFRNGLGMQLDQDFSLQTIHTAEVSATNESSESVENILDYGAG